MQRLALFAPLLLTAGLVAQVPDGWYVWSSFQGRPGINGIFFSHPRDATVPFVSVTGLSPALAYDPAGRRGGSCVVRRPSDGALLVGERAPVGTSVDLHVLTLNGADVVRAQLFSMGTSAGAGEIPQCALLPDGRVLVAATDLTAGSPLAQFLTAQYNWEGLGILDIDSGSITPVPISNFSQFPGVINGMAASRDGTVAYIGNYISASSGDLWSVPLPGGGAATRVAQLSTPASNVGVDADGNVLVTALNGPPNLFEVDPLTGNVTTIPTTSGPLNAIAVETVTGNYAIASANSGTPARSLFWMTPAGQETWLYFPDRATISGVDVNHNPEVFAPGTAGQATYDWVLAPNPGGLPEVGNAGFSLTLEADSALPSMCLFVLGLRRADPPITQFGIDIHVDPTGSATSLLNFATGATIPLPIPNDPALTGLALYGQSLHLEVVQLNLAASPAVALTIL